MAAARARPTPPGRQAIPEQGRAHFAVGSEPALARKGWEEDSGEAATTYRSYQAATIHDGSGCIGGHSGQRLLRPSTSTEADDATSARPDHTRLTGRSEPGQLRRFGVRNR